MVTIEKGDCVFVRGGRFNGCVLTYVRPDGRGHIVINSTYGDPLYGHLKVPGVELHRKGKPEYADGTTAERQRQGIGL